MNTFLIAVLVIFLSANVNAQLRKCTAADGKITYSDFLCTGNSKTGSIQNQNGNTLDTSGMREQAQKDQINRPEPIGDFGLAQALARNPSQGGKNIAIQAALAQQNNATRLRVAEIAAGLKPSEPIGDFGLEAALMRNASEGGKRAAVQAALAQQENATNLRIAQILAGAKTPAHITQTPNSSSSAYQTRDRFGNLANSEENYKTIDRNGNLVNSQDNHKTKDRFGNFVDSQSCYKTKDNFGNLVDSAGCSK